MKYLLLGKTGFVAEHFIGLLDCNCYNYKAISRRDLDYTNHSVLKRYTRDHNIDVVINCAGYTGRPNVDACESNKEQTIEGNILTAKTIATVCFENDMNLIHVSSGCIYNGYDKIFTEEDAPNFTLDEGDGSFYSGTKAIAEREVLSSNPYTYICRLRIPFNHEDGPRNYISKLINYSTLLNLPNSISHLGDFVNACIYLQESSSKFGIYNVVNTDALYAKEICQLITESGVSDKEFIFHESLEEFYEQTGAIAKRSNCVLDNSKLLATGFEMRSSMEAIKQSLHDWLPL